MKHCHIASGADTERRPPKGQTAGNEDMGMRPLTVSMTLLIKCVCKPVQRPYLATMRMTAELYVHAKRIGLSQAVRLMVEYKYGL